MSYVDAKKTGTPTSMAETFRIANQLTQLCRHFYAPGINRPNIMQRAQIFLAGSDDRVRVNHCSVNAALIDYKPLKNV